MQQTHIIRWDRRDVNGYPWVQVIWYPAPLDKYSIRARLHTHAGISIWVIHGYLDTHGYSRVPMDFLIKFFV